MLRGDHGARSGWGSLFWVLLGVMVVATGLLGVACSPAQAPLGQADARATVDEVLGDPQRFAGQRVVLEGQVERMVSDRVIALQSSNADQTMLAVLADQALTSIDTIEVGDLLQITGQVQPVTEEQILAVEKQLSIDLDEVQIVNLANQAPFIVAERVTK